MENYDVGDGRYCHFGLKTVQVKLGLLLGTRNSSTEFPLCLDEL
jgi:hypothetical protein